MTTFSKTFQRYNWQTITPSIYQKTAQDVERALKRVGHCDLEDFKAMVSPAAVPYLETMAQLSRSRTLKRFGNTIQLYIPLYLSNECTNICTYCGFSQNNEVPRRTLNVSELTAECMAIKSMGFDHILLVTGEAPKHVGLSYFEEAIQIVRSFFSNVSIEVQPLSTHAYRTLIDLGLNAVYLYQETYHQDRYTNYHLKGRKRNFAYRLDSPDRLGRAGIQKIGLGTLMGLEDWRTEAWYLALHLRYLQKKYWQTKYSISFPRLRPAAGAFAPNVITSDRDLVQLICAYRLLEENVELSLSTRESEMFRDHAVHLGITTMSAGSKTDPGGYTVDHEAQEQFEIQDDRDPHSFAAMIRGQGYEPVWKDWDRHYAAPVPIPQGF